MPYDVFIGCPEEEGVQVTEQDYARLDAKQVRTLVDQQPDLTFMQHDENVAGDKRLRVFLLRNKPTESARVDDKPNGVPPEMLPQVTEALRDVLTMMERKANELGVGFSPDLARSQPSQNTHENHTAVEEPPKRMSPVRIHIFSAAPPPDEIRTVHHFGIESDTTGKELVSASKQIKRLRTRDQRLEGIRNARARRIRDHKFERLRVALAKYLEAESFFRSRIAVWRMAKLRPRHSEVRLAQAFLKEQTGPSAFLASVVMFFPDLYFVLGEELARCGRVLMMPFFGRKRTQG
jgi:hypothetical protein